MKKLITIFLIFMLAHTLSSHSQNLPIIPTPKLVKVLNGTFKLKDKIVISIMNSAEANSYTADLIIRTLKDFNGVSASLGNNGGIEINYIGKDEQDHVIANLSEDGYVLRILENKIELKAKTPKGIYYAAMSLIQLLEKTNNEIKCIEIIDWPDMEIRGISDDISRGQVSNLENFKKIIFHIARYKMNTYMPYLEDMLEFEKYPSIGKGRGALTKEEVKEIVAFVKKNFVEVIPIFQTLGHYENILSQNEFVKYAEFPGAASLNVSSEDTYTFLEDLLKEVFSLFPSEYFHMGADESWDVGLGASKKLVQESNIAVVHANHYKKVYNICKKYNKKVMMYGDILLDHPQILDLIPKDITIVDWHYGAEPNYSSTKKIKQAGFNYIVSPSVWNFVTIFPVNSISLPNIKYLVKSGIQNESIGMVNSNWGDYGAETFKEFVLYNYAWSAQCSWSFDDSDLNKFTKDYFNDFFGIDDSRLSNFYKTLSEPHNQIPWHNIWRHPLLKFKEPGWWEPRVSKVEQITWNELTLSAIENDLAQVKSLVKKNKDHLELLHYILKLTNWFKMKVETQFAIQKLINDKESGDLSFVSNAIDSNISVLQSLKQDFRKLWLRYYKEANLKMIEDKFDRLIKYFEETKSTLTLRSIENYNPLIKSKWLYFKQNDSSYASNAEFTTTIVVEDNIDEAYFQLMGNTHAKLFINDKFVDEVFVKHSLSLLVDYKRIKLINVKPFLISGKNSIRIIAETFNNDGAGFNLMGRIKYPGTEQFVMSDDKSDSKVGWAGRQIGSTVWGNVISKPYPLEVIAPNFETLRTSWIER
ncbi:MAG: beta-N-acetylhexosaminidase [Ignavibacteriaceae bacterium]|nr:beta-N-acetylhexosaminidase [Ignavibacteriaceae bacterium]